MDDQTPPDSISESRKQISFTIPAELHDRARVFRLAHGLKAGWLWAELIRIGLETVERAEGIQ